MLHQAALGLGAALDRRPARHRTMSTSPASSTCSTRRATPGSTRFVYAASSSTYGDEPDLPKVEDRIGNPLSPYAATKLINEIYADVYARGLRLRGDRPALFQRLRAAPGPRRRLCRGDPEMGRGDDRATRTVVINGDGETSRDFCLRRQCRAGQLRAALAARRSAGRGLQCCGRRAHQPQSNCSA